MSKQHQASRRRTYGRRQHEMNQRFERPVGYLGWVEVRDSGDTEDRSGFDRFGRAVADDGLVAQGID
jgi:hypothetical protein